MKYKKLMEHIKIIGLFCGCSLKRSLKFLCEVKISVCICGDKKFSHNPIIWMNIRLLLWVCVCAQSTCWIPFTLSYQFLSQQPTLKSSRSFFFIRSFLFHCHSVPYSLPTRIHTFFIHSFIQSLWMLRHANVCDVFFHLHKMIFHGTFYISMVGNKIKFSFFLEFNWGENTTLA